LEKNTAPFRYGLDVVPVRKKNQEQLIGVAEPYEQFMVELIPENGKMGREEGGGTDF